MMRKYKYGLWFVILPCWMSVAVAEPAENRAAASAASGVAASAVGVEPSAEEDYQAALKADAAGEMLEAGRLFLRAAERGHAAAQVQAAYGLRQASLDKGAFEFFRKAAEQGDTHGMRGLATMYAENGERQNFAEARKWFVRAADSGDEKAVVIMAEAYMRGSLGFDEAAQNSPEALGWINRAVDCKYPPAYAALAEAYRAGKFGLEADPKQADELIAKMNKILGIEEKKKKKERIVK